MNQNQFQADQKAVYRQAERIVEAKLKFYHNLVTYFIVTGLLISGWLATVDLNLDLAAWPGIQGWHYPWFLLVLVPLGIGLTIQFLTAFVLSRIQA